MPQIEPDAFSNLDKMKERQTADAKTPEGTSDSASGQPQQAGMILFVSTQFEKVNHGIRLVKPTYFFSLHNLFHHFSLNRLCRRRFN